MLCPGNKAMELVTHASHVSHRATERSEDVDTLEKGRVLGGLIQISRYFRCDWSLFGSKSGVSAELPPLLSARASTAVQCLCGKGALK